MQKKKKIKWNIEAGSIHSQQQECAENTDLFSECIKYREE